MAKFAILLLFGITLVQVYAQEVVNKNIAKGIQECYNNDELIDANLKMPMTMNLLIDFIRKVENGPTPMDLKVMATSFLHRFRQDGIRKAASVINSKIIPYSTSGHEFEKFRIVLYKIVPGNTAIFPNETLTPLERCTIHHMLSESVEALQRENENFECNQKEKYRLRARRSPEVLEDVELINEKDFNNKEKNNNQMIRQPSINPNSDVDVLPKINLPSDKLSNCPLENGVVYSKWGAVSAGYVIAGIAAGSEPQTIKVDNKYEIDNVFGATLAGDVAEAGYLSLANGEPLEIGADGNWLSSVVPHGYYIEKNTNFYFTNAEIRGNLDGLILGTKMKDYRNSARSMKLSQLLDMYYSERGVFSENLKACRRQELYTEFVDSDNLETQSRGLTALLQKIATVTMTSDDSTVDESIKEAANKFGTYIPQYLRDVNCLNNNNPFQVLDADIVILLDCSWQFETIYSFLTYLFENGDVNPYNTNITIINAQNGQLILESQNSIAEFYKNFNETVYRSQAQGFDISVALQQLEVLTKEKMDYETQNNVEVNGKSFIGLFLARSSSIDKNKKQFIIDRLNEIIRPKIPDLRLIALTAGSVEDFYDIVKDSTKDIIQIQDNNNSDNIISSINKLIDRLKQIQKRISNFKCNSNWTETGNDKSMIQYIEPNGIKFYRLHQNYFFDSSFSSVKVKGHNTGTLNVCYSRLYVLPVGNSTGSTEGSTELVCKVINNEEFAIELRDPCYGSSLSECLPLYISVQSQQAKTNYGLEICREKGCRFTDNIKFTISTENLRCNSGNILLTNTYIFISIIFIAFIRNV